MGVRRDGLGNIRVGHGNGLSMSLLLFISDCSAYSTLIVIDPSPFIPYLTAETEGVRRGSVEVR